MCRRYSKMSQSGFGQKSLGLYKRTWWRLSLIPGETLVGLWYDHYYRMSRDKLEKMRWKMAKSIFTHLSLNNNMLLCLAPLACMFNFCTYHHTLTSWIFNFSIMSSQTTLATSRPHSVFLKAPLSMQRLQVNTAPSASSGRHISKHDHKGITCSHKVWVLSSEGISTVIWRLFSPWTRYIFTLGMELIELCQLGQSVPP